MKQSPDSKIKKLALATVVAVPTAIIGTVAYLNTERNDTRDAVVSVLDEDAKQAQKIRELFDTIDSLKKELENIDDDVDTNAKEVITQPGSVVARIRNVRDVVTALSLTVDEVAATGFKVNSGVVYREVIDIDANLAKLRGNNWVKYGSYVSGELNLPGKAGQSVQIINELSGLQNDLVKLRKSLDGIADVNIEEFSNNKYVNTPIGPREMFRQRMAAVDVVLAKRPHTCDFGTEARLFLDEYGFAKYPDDLDFTDPDYFERLGEFSHKGFTKYIAVMKTAFESTLKYKASGQPTNHPNIRKFQEMLALGGYYDYNKIDGSYGELTHNSFKKFWKDFGDGDIPEYLNVHE